MINQTNSKLCYDSRKMKAKLLDSLPERLPSPTQKNTPDIRCMKPLIVSPDSVDYEYTLTLTINGVEIELSTLSQSAREIEKDFNSQLEIYTHLRLMVEEALHTLPSRTYPIRYQNTKFTLVGLHASDSVTIDKSKNIPTFMKEGNQSRLEADLNNGISGSLIISGGVIIRDTQETPPVLCSNIKTLNVEDFTHIYLKLNETRDVTLEVGFLNRLHFDQRISAELVGVNLEPNTIITLKVENGFLGVRMTDEGPSILMNKHISHPYPVTCPKEITLGPYDRNVFALLMVIAGDGRKCRKFSSGIVRLKLTKSFRTL